MNASADNGHLLTPSEKAFLRELAGAAVEAAVTGGPLPDAAALAAARDLDLAGNLLQKRGAFVTLHLDGRLRGCIGYIEGVKPLVEAVIDNGRSAAVHDPRFRPVTAAELPRLELEISALTPLRPVRTPEEIELGRHGIVLAKGGARAVFLPQVAPEQGWDLHTTLGHLALKAGLGPQGWQEGARFEVFEAEVF